MLAPKTIRLKKTSITGYTGHNTSFQGQDPRGDQTAAMAAGEEDFLLRVAHVQRVTWPSLKNWDPRIEGKFGQPLSGQELPG